MVYTHKQIYMNKLNDSVANFVMAHVRHDTRNSCCDIILFKNAFYLTTKIWTRIYFKN